MSRLAAAERTNKPVHPAAAFFARMVPPRVLGAVHARTVRSWSSVLNGDKV